MAVSMLIIYADNFVLARKTAFNLGIKYQEISFGMNLF